MDSDQPESAAAVDTTLRQQWRDLSWHATSLPSVPGVPTPNTVTAAPAVPAPAPAAPAGPLPIPLGPLERLRGLKRAYDDVLDVTLMSLGYSGGCAVDLQRGLVYPPGAWPTQQ